VCLDVGMYCSVLTSSGMQSLGKFRRPARKATTCSCNSWLEVKQAAFLPQRFVAALNIAALGPLYLIHY
jgi:hypothetical protein